MNRISIAIIGLGYAGLPLARLFATVCDPWANPGEVKREYGLEIWKEMPAGAFDAAVLTVSRSSPPTCRGTSRRK